MQTLPDKLAAFHVIIGAEPVAHVSPPLGETTVIVGATFFTTTWKVPKADAPSLSVTVTLTV